MKTNPNDPINAALDTNYREGVPSLELRYEGLTKREYFAAMAMQGLNAAKLYRNTDVISNTLWNSSEIARRAVQDADALIKELNKE